MKKQRLEIRETLLHYCLSEVEDLPCHSRGDGNLEKKNKQNKYSILNTNPMKKFIYHFRRDRSYHRHDRWAVFVILAIVTTFVLFVNWSRLITPMDDEMILAVKDIHISKNIVEAGSTTFSNITIQLIDENSRPAKQIWVGLKILEKENRTPEFTHEDWYSYEPDRSFYQTDSTGRVKFPIASHITGEVEYSIYSANPDALKNQKYHDLNSSFVITFE